MGSVPFRPRNGLLRLRGIERQATVRAAETAPYVGDHGFDLFRASQCCRNGLYARDEIQGIER